MKNSILIAFAFLTIPLGVFGQSETKLSKKERKRIEKKAKYDVIKESINDTVFYFKSRKKTKNGYNSLSKGHINVAKNSGSADLGHEDKYVDVNSYIGGGFAISNYRITEHNQGEEIKVSFSLRSNGAVYKLNLITTFEKTSLHVKGSNGADIMYFGRLVSR